MQGATKIINANAYTKINNNGKIAAFVIFEYLFSPTTCAEKLADIAVGGKNSPVAATNDKAEATNISSAIPSIAEHLRSSTAFS